jgi:hypothetical protein
MRAMPDFYRIKRLPPYVFEQVNRFKAAARQWSGHHRPGMGSLDELGYRTGTRVTIQRIARF